MTRAQIYRKAAEIVDAEFRTFACVAIDDVVGEADEEGFSQPTLDFQALYDCGDDGRNQFGDPCALSRNHRVFALLFAAEYYS